MKDFTITFYRILCRDNVDFRFCGDRSKHVEQLPPCSETSVKGFFRSWKLAVDRVGNYDNALDQVCERTAAVITPLVNQGPVKTQVCIQVSPPMFPFPFSSSIHIFNH